MRSLPSSPSVAIQVQLGGRVRNLERPKDEPVEKPLMRLQKSAIEKPKGKKKKKKGEVEEEVPVPEVQLFSGPDESFPLIDPQKTSNESAWMQDFLLKIGDKKYSIVVNPPAVEKLHVHGRVFSHVPVVPHVEATSSDSLRWQWYRKGRGTSDWEMIKEAFDRFYTPGNDDMGSMLRVCCTPSQHRQNEFTGDEYNLIGFTSELEIGPIQEPPMFASTGRITAQQQSWTEHPALRVMTYNILADQYASTDTAKDVIFSHCSPEFLAWQYRRPLILKEILDYKPDVACLQEVDASAFELLLQPGLGAFGLDGVYTNKAGRVKEGSATFWRRDRFDIIDRQELEMRNLFPKSFSREDIDSAPLGPALRPMLESSPNLCDALQRVGTVAQMTMLVPRGDPSTWGVSRPLCVVNTHLFFHYAAPHIRTLHVWAMLNAAKIFIDRVVAEKSDMCGKIRPNLIFCGDLNSDINDGIPGAVELLRSGVVKSSHWDWKFGANFSWNQSSRGEEDESGEVSKMVHSDVEGLSPTRSAGSDAIVPGLDLTSPFSPLDTADGMIPEFTNYVKGYQGLLDYVWYEHDHLKVTGFLPYPGKDDLQGYLPSGQYPSDHLAVVADLEFTETNMARVPQDQWTFGSTVEATYRNVPLAEDALMQDHVIAVPTDTIYGLAALACSAKAINEIYSIKQRDFMKPLAVCVADHDDIADICHIQHLPPNLLKALLPGPVTVVLDRKTDTNKLSEELNPGVDALAVRIPDSPFLRAVCRHVQMPLALTSANISGDQSPIQTAEMDGVADQCALIFDHGKVGELRAGSTIIDLRQPGTFSVIRPGSALEATCNLAIQHGLAIRDSI